MDPDDHHVYVSLGCAAENLTQSALAHGLRADVDFDKTREAGQHLVKNLRERTSEVAYPRGYDVEQHKCCGNDKNVNETES